MPRKQQNRSSLDGPPGGLEAGPLSNSVIGAFFSVYNDLGYGLPECIYGRALAILLRERGIHAAREAPIEVWYHGQCIGAYRADLIVDDTIVVELKAGPMLAPGAKAQLINYLRTSKLEVGLLFYFGPSPDFHRVVYSRRNRAE
jgi:GxxExxY protein